MLTGNLVKLREVMAEMDIHLTADELAVTKEAIHLYLEWHHPLREDISAKKELLEDVLVKLIKVRIGK